MAKAPLSQTLILTEDGSTIAMTAALAVTIPSTLIIDPLPVFIQSPSILGTPHVGEELTGMDGTITNGTVVSRRWLLGATVVSTAQTYAATAAGLLTYEVTAAGSGGTTVATSAAVTMVPVFTSQPAIATDGSPTVGEVVTLDFGAIAGDAIGARQILRADNTVVATVTTGSYELAEAGQIKLRVYAAATAGLFAETPLVTVSAAATFQAVQLAFEEGRTAGSNPVRIRNLNGGGDAEADVHSLRLEQSQDDFATVRESETVPFGEIALAWQDPEGFDWTTLGVEPVGPYQARIVTVVTATGEVVAVSNIIRDTLNKAPGLTFVSFGMPNAKTGNATFAPGRNLIVTRGDAQATSLVVAGVNATSLGTASGGTRTEFWEVTLPSGGNKSYTFTGSGGGTDLRMWVLELFGYGAKVDGSFQPEGPRGAFNSSLPSPFSATGADPTPVPAGGLAVHAFLQVSGQIASPLNNEFVDTRDSTTFIIAQGTANGLPQGFTVPNSNRHDPGSQCFVTFAPAS